MLLANIAHSLHSSKGRIIISIILGLGLASLFRRVCNDRNCMVFKAPSLEEVTNNTYAYNNKCYNFKSKSMKCGSTAKQVNFA